MISRRHFLYTAGGLTAATASTAAYGLSEPVVRLTLTRYDLSPRQWPSDFPLKIAALADFY